MRKPQMRCAQGCLPSAGADTVCLGPWGLVKSRASFEAMANAAKEGQQSAQPAGESRTRIR